MSEESLLSATEVSVSMGGRSILHGVSIELKAGEVLGLIGPNGAGKSTLLAVLAGDIRPDQGRVTLRGRDYRDYSAKEAAQARSVMLQDSTVSFAHLIRDVVEMGRSPWPKDPEMHRKVVDSCLEEVGMLHMQDREITTLSGGERARVAMARVMAQQARAVMLDEPTAAMDIGHQERTMRSARRLAAKGDGVIVVLHDLNLAAQYCDRLALLDAGTVVSCGPPQQVCTTERLSEVYHWPVSVSQVDESLWIRPTPDAEPDGNQPFG